jgi:class 3 adenylate cyclase
VNLAFRLRSTAEAGRIHISESTYEFLKYKYQFEKTHSPPSNSQSDLIAYWLGRRLEHPAGMEVHGKVAA